MKTLTPRPRKRYDPVAKLFHWLMAVALMVIFGLGLYMTGLAFSPEKLKLLSWHKWAGIVILALALLRLIWRLTHKPPSMPAGMSRSQQLSAHGAHALLYVLMIAIPMSGWLMSSAKGVPTVLFGVWALPDLVARNRELGDLLQTVHWYLNVSLAVVVIVHVAAAVKHHFVNRDEILTRMLPFK